ncbi:MAG: hypothetical protein RSA23_09990 [Carnobacterium sp.]
MLREVNQQGAKGDKTMIKYTFDGDDINCGEEFDYEVDDYKKANAIKVKKLNSMSVNEIVEDINCQIATLTKEKLIELIIAYLPDEMFDSLYEDELRQGFEGEARSEYQNQCDLENERNKQNYDN